MLLSELWGILFQNYLAVPRLARRSESISLSKAAATLCNLLDKPAGSSWTPELQGYCQGLKDGYYPFPSPRPPQSDLQSPRQLAVPFCPSVPPDHGQDSQNGHNPSPSPKLPRRSLQLPREPALHFVRQATAKTFSSEAFRPEPGRHKASNKRPGSQSMPTVPGVSRSVSGVPAFIDPRAGRAELAPQMNGARSKPH